MSSKTDPSKGQSAVESNAPVSIQEIEEALSDELVRLEGVVGGRLLLEPLGRQKTVADSTTKVLVRTHAKVPVAVIVCARPIAPELVSRGVALAEQVRGVIGEELGQAVIRPIRSGYLSGRSYVVLPCCSEFADFKPLRVIQRLRLKRPLLDWLCRANAAAVAFHASNEGAAGHYHDVLSHLAQRNLFNGAIQSAIRAATTRLESGRWTPNLTFDHNDLWLGNVMLPPRANPLFDARSDFILIDWAGANPQGHGIYDLVRLAIGLKLSRAELRKQLARHADTLHCDLEDTRGHLLAALGRLHVHLEHFPEKRYAQTFQNCWDAVQGALR